MKHFKQYRPLVVEEVSEDKFHYPHHHQNYYELVYIDQGNGISHINTTNLPYQPGDIFFVSPEDDHFFEVHEYTTFVFIKFTNEYLKNVQTILLPWQQNNFEPISLFSNNYLKENTLKWNTIEKERIKNTILHILQYKNKDILPDSLVVYFQILIILSSVHENLMSTRKLQFSNENYNTQLINYIHQFIYSPEYLKITIIARHFNISVQYFSAWFKQTFQISYKNYIDQYRIELLKNRLSYTHSSFQSIADEFGFSDSSHFSNYFFKHTGTRPLTYRKESLKLENILQSNKDIRGK